MIVLNGLNLAFPVADDVCGLVRRGFNDLNIVLRRHWSFLIDRVVFPSVVFLLASVPGHRFAPAGIVPADICPTLH